MTCFSCCCSKKSYLRTHDRDTPPSDPIAYYSEYHSNPHTISNRHIIFKQKRNKIGCSLHGKEWQWPLREIAAELDNVTRVTRCWNLGSETYGNQHELFRQHIGTFIKGVLTLRNVTIINRMVTKQNDHWWMAVKVLLCKIFSLGFYDTEKLKVPSIINNGNIENMPYWLNQDSNREDILPLAPLLTFTDKTPSDLHPKKRLAVALKLFVEDTRDGAQLTDYFDFNAVMDKEFRDRYPDFKPEDWTIDALYRAERSNPAAIEISATLSYPGASFLHGNRLDP